MGASGQTKGRGRNDHAGRGGESVKEIYVDPLLVQDTTDLNSSSRPHTNGLGLIGTNQA